MTIADSLPQSTAPTSRQAASRDLTGVDILGVHVSSGTTDDVIAMIDDRQRIGATTRIAFLNAHLSNVCARDDELRRQLRDFIILNDGIGLDIARRLLHRSQFPENLNGTDFTTAFLDRTERDLKVFLLGAQPDVIRRAAQLFAARWPRHSVVGFHHGFLTPADAQAVAAEIARTSPDLVLVGMGNPRQERWIADNVPHVSPCAIAVGAWFDFFTGSVPRAPRWIRRSRIEWVYRLWREPRRLARRYLIGNFVFVGRVAVTRFKSAARS